MSRARVWAPTAGRVSVEVGGRSQGLDRTSGGWWESAENVLDHGTDYRFRLDSGDPLPDPRSPWQPEGVHGPSRWVEHSRFEWRDTGWRAPDLAEAVFYELHVGTFTSAGTFEGVAQRLPYLRELGVTHVELMPVNAFPGNRGWGYDGVDLYAPHHPYGGPEELKRLVDAAHGHGLAMVLDVVYNHFGPDGNYVGRFGPYLTERYDTPWGGAVNLDGPGSDEVRRFFVDNALMWLRDYHFDGLRLDAVHAFVDLSAVHFLEELAQAVDRIEEEVGRLLTLVAESDLNDPQVIRPRAEHGYGIDAQWSDELHHALHVALTGEREGYYADFGGLADLCTALREGWVYDWRHAPARGRRHGRRLTDMPRWRLLGYSQNHDQVGNRAAGERLSQLVGQDALRVAAALVILGPHVPLIFQGEEWAAATPFQFFTNHTDAELGRSVTEGRTHEFEAFGWDPADVPDPQAPETFERSRLDWSEPEREPHAGMLEWYRRLLLARRTIPGLAAGPAPQVRCSEDEGWLTVERAGTLLAASLGDRPHDVPLRGDWRLELASAAGLDLADGRLTMPPLSAALLLSGRT
ncbi:MAG TPA: malto-oligosyltrehalose trehalohydrolase [Candidatus Limnocylindria bacterium]|nr:malto-oligosyltrehalose trehalohydrolase [Candidatus Limnocylindria bacterium]